MSTLTNPASDMREVVLDSDMTGVRSLYINGAGDISFVTLSGETRTRPVQAGTLPLRVKRVNTSGTTATGISAFF